ncbi:MAG: hypothetical protein R3B68_15280 [Phycisphaerales bacterium]
MAIQIEYRLRQHGWATFALVDGKRRHEGQSGYMGNPIGELARAARGWACQEGTAYVHFVYEPGALVCRATCSSEHVRVELRDEPYGMRDGRGKRFDKRGEMGTTLFDATEERATFICRIAELLHRLWREHGCSGYQARWRGSPFPLADYLSLRLLVDSSPEAERVRACRRLGESTVGDDLALLAAPMLPDPAGLYRRALDDLRSPSPAPE